MEPKGSRGACSSTWKAWTAVVISWAATVRFRAKLTHFRADSTSPFIMSPMVPCSSSLSRLISLSNAMPVS